ncbi:MAG: helix-turn-helix transcriptional regulator [Bacilli bacterium]|nr:helix-turn-helix transcriptional regulator [Bacilli bacterium]
MTLRYEELRLDSEKKQGEIAEILSVKRNTYSKWENLINDMPLEKCNELANYYKTTLDYVLGLSNTREYIDTPLNIDWKLVSERLSELRHLKNLTERELSSKIGFAQTTYSYYEIGKRRPTTMKLLSIAQYYNVSIDYIVGRSNNTLISRK